MVSEGSFKDNTDYTYDDKLCDLSEEYKLCGMLYIPVILLASMLPHFDSISFLLV